MLLYETEIRGFHSKSKEIIQKRCPAIQISENTVYRSREFINKEGSQYKVEHPRNDGAQPVDQGVSGKFL